MARLTLGDYGYALAQPQPLQAVDVNAGLFEGTQNVLNDQARHVQEVEKAQSLELNADVESYKNQAVKNMDALNQQVLEGNLPAEKYQSTLNEMNSQLSQPLETKWADTAFKEDVKNELTIKNSAIDTMAFEQEQKHVNDKVLAQTDRNLYELLNSNDSPDTVISKANSILDSAPMSSQEREAKKQVFSDKVVVGQWDLVISNAVDKKDMSILDKINVNDIPTSKDQKAILQNKINSARNAIEAENNKANKLAQLQTQQQAQTVLGELQNGNPKAGEAAINLINDPNLDEKSKFQLSYNLSLQDDVQKLKNMPVIEQNITMNKVLMEAKASGDIDKITRANSLAEISNSLQQQIKTNPVEYMATHKGIVPPDNYLYAVDELDKTGDATGVLMMLNSPEVKNWNTQTKVATGENLSILQGKVANNVENWINAQPPQRKAEILSTIYQDNPSNLSTLSQVNQNNKMIGMIANHVSPQVATEVAYGNNFIASKPAGVNFEGLTTKIRTSLPEYFTNSPNVSSLVTEAVTALYVTRQSQQGVTDFSKDYKKKAIETAINDVTGGVVNFGGAKTIKPPHMNDDDFINLANSLIRGKLSEVGYDDLLDKGVVQLVLPTEDATIGVYALRREGEAQNLTYPDGTPIIINMSQTYIPITDNKVNKSSIQDQFNARMDMTGTN